MKDDEGRVLVPHYYDGVKLTERERSMLRAVPDEEAAILKRLGIAKPEKVGENLQEAVQSLPTTFAECNRRPLARRRQTYPGDCDRRARLAHYTRRQCCLSGRCHRKAHSRAGLSFGDGQPSDDERAKYPKIASLTLRRGSNAAFSEMETPAGTWVQDASAETFASNGQPAKTVRIRLMGGSVPTDKLVEALDIPFVIVPLVNPDNNHTVKTRTSGSVTISTACVRS